jgi:hypothetical protein
MVFLDPTKPIATCAASDCNDCAVADSVHCHFRPMELTHFFLISLPAFIIGGAGVLAGGFIALAIWIIMIVGYFGFIEIRVMCSHCPHYAEETSILGCWANHGAPKIWKYRPGPMSMVENIVFIGGLILVFGYPVLFLVMGALWFLLSLYVLTSAAFFLTLKMFLCSQCMNFACPFNGVPDSTRLLFFERNPTAHGGG